MYSSLNMYEGLCPQTLYYTDIWYEDICFAWKTQENPLQKELQNHNSDEIYREEDKIENLSVSSSVPTTLFDEEDEGESLSDDGSHLTTEFKSSSFILEETVNNKNENKDIITSESKCVLSSLSVSDLSTLTLTDLEMSELESQPSNNTTYISSQEKTNTGSNDWIEIPPELNRSNKMLDIQGLAKSGKLFLAQTCGWPLLHGGGENYYSVVAVPKYNFPGCNGSEYSSVIVVNKANHKIQNVNDIYGKTVVINSRSSCSGCLLLACTLGKEIMQTTTTIYSGSHVESLKLVSEGKADVASIDCVTFGLLKHYCPSKVQNIRILTFSKYTLPSLPYITSANASPQVVQRLRIALEKGIGTSSFAACALGLKGFDFTVNVATFTERIINLQKIAASFSKDTQTIDNKLQIDSIKSSFLNDDHHHNVNDTFKEKIRIDPLAHKNKLQKKLPNDQNFIREALSILKRFAQSESCTTIDDKVQKENNCVSCAYPDINRNNVRKEKLKEKDSSRRDDPVHEPREIDWRISNGKLIRLVFPGGRKIVEQIFSGKKTENGKNEVKELHFTCFVGNRPPVYACTSMDHIHVHQCWELDDNIMKSVSPDLVLAYISMEVNSGGDHGNLVFFQPHVDADQFRRDKNVKASGHPPHTVARYYYSSIRIHRCIYNFNSKNRFREDANLNENGNNYDPWQNKSNVQTCKSQSNVNLRKEDTFKINSTTSLEFHHPIILKENGEEEGGIRRPSREIIHWTDRESNYEVANCKAKIKKID